MKYVLIIMIILFVVAVILFRMVGKMFLANLKRKNPGDEFSANIDVSFYTNSPVRKLADEGMEFMKTLEMEDVYIKSKDNLKLHGRIFTTTKNSKRFVLGIHGFQSHALNEFGPHVKYYQKKGFNMLLVDDRAHEYSEGDYITMGVKDRLDCVEWAKYLVQRYGEDVQILLHGVSMGAATVVSASGERELPAQVIGTICDCGFTSVSEALYYQMKSLFHISSKTLVKVCAWYAKKVANFDFEEGAPIDEVHHSKVPVLFVQGEIDHIVPAWMAQKLYDACNTSKELIIVKNASHAESIAIDPDAYHEGMESLFGI